MLPILYQDEHLVVVNKPAKMLVHPSFLDKHESTFVVEILKEQLGQSVFPIHRLDKPTSGVLLLALNRQIAHQLALQFEHHTVEKVYWAVVRGYLLGEGQIDYALKPRWDKIADKFSDKNKPAQSAITHYKNLAITEQPFISTKRFTTSRYSWVELCPKTGRKHQLRRHMTHLFHPIIGDTTYGDTTQNRAILEHVGVSRLLLHAHRLSFQHPTLNKKLTITAALDDEFLKIFHKFGWHVD